MRYAKALSISAAFALTIFAPGTPAAGKNPRIVVIAPPSSEIVVRRVSFADLNLASPAGERSLNSRVSYAVNDLCYDVTGGDDGTLRMKQVLKKCSGSAWDQARPQMAQAIQRAREIAQTGTSSITAAALTISLPPL
jgi:UrcA family protein